jgi:Uma2 family endonuclease
VCPSSGCHDDNPTLVIEVLSASTEQADRGENWQHHQLRPSLQEDVLVSQSHARVERYRGLAAGGWEYTTRPRGRCRYRPARCSISRGGTRSCRTDRRSAVARLGIARGGERALTRRRRP